MSWICLCCHCMAWFLACPHVSPRIDVFVVVSTSLQLSLPHKKHKQWVLLKLRGTILPDQNSSLPSRKSSPLSIETPFHLRLKSQYTGEAQTRAFVFGIRAASLVQKFPAVHQTTERQLKRGSASYRSNLLMTPTSETNAHLVNGSIRSSRWTTQRRRTRNTIGPWTTISPYHCQQPLINLPPMNSFRCPPPLRAKLETLISASRRVVILSGCQKHTAQVSQYPASVNISADETVGPQGNLGDILNPTATPELSRSNSRGKHPPWPGVGTNCWLCEDVNGGRIGPRTVTNAGFTIQLLARIESSGNTTGSNSDNEGSARK